VGTDKFLRTMGIGQYARESAEAYVKRGDKSQPLVEAYIAGINNYIENNPKTLEHTILGIDVEPFTIENPFEVLTYIAFGFANAHKTDPWLTELSAKLDSSYIADLNIYHYEGESILKNFDDRYSLISEETVALLEKLNVPQFIGSNSWVLSGKKTKSGKVLLANDPHIGFSQPSVWYEAHMVMPKSEYYGYHLAGFPFAPLFHTSTVANGITMFENDDLDFYVETIHPDDSNQYKYKGEWTKMTSREEIINVMDGEDVKFTIRSTNHGPVVTDILLEEPLEDIVSMYWVTTRMEGVVMEAMYKLSLAENLSQMEEVASKVHGPGLNIMYGDANGNIAWWAAGKLIKRRDEQSSKTYYDGSTGLDDPDSHYGFDKNPRAINPDWGYVHSANNQPDTVDGVLYSGYYLPDDRGERIAELLDGQEKWSVDEVKEMMLDIKSKLFENVKDIMLDAVKDSDESELISKLTEWDATFSNDDFRPVVFNRWMYEILEAAMLDEMGESLWELSKETQDYKGMIEHLLKNEESKWWDDTNTSEVESRTLIISRAFSESLVALRESWGEDYTSWKWGDSHLLTHPHALGSKLSFLNVGTFNVSGTNEVINNLMYTWTGDKYQNVVAGPSTRRIIDFSDIRNNSWSILPTGQSGNYFSPYYDDQAEMFVNGVFRKMIMNHEEIKNSKNKLTLSPDK
ncbi:MAG: penicillin acylase family protein, partial [Cytophagales bacterium]|nr:penicillin acylase family protein [Cytophagales bacterium]